MTQVMIYNLGGSQVLGHVSLKHAIGMLYRKVARVHTSVEGEVFGPYERPAAVELLNYVYTKWMYERTGRVVYSRTALLRRDRHRCAYCGKSASTVDHIRPRSHGGPTSWLNCVAACVKCNEKKDDRTPDQAGMPLRFTPFVPTLAQIRPGG